MRVLVYKRTHDGDPDSEGRFGIHDCMGEIRGRSFEAVIGIGGKGKDAIKSGVCGKINWIGITPHKTTDPETGYLIVTFAKFKFFGTEGARLRQVALNLAKRMYDSGNNGQGSRHSMNFSQEEQGEIERILATLKSPTAVIKPSSTSKRKFC
jgi:hypothetical protein